jgi:hypothetical protein
LGANGVKFATSTDGIASAASNSNGTTFRSIAVICSRAPFRTPSTLRIVKPHTSACATANFPPRARLERRREPRDVADDRDRDPRVADGRADPVAPRDEEARELAERLAREPVRPARARERGPSFA